MVSAWQIVVGVTLLEGCALVVMNTVAILVITTSKKMRTNFNNVILCFLFIFHLCSGISIVVLAALRIKLVYNVQNAEVILLKNIRNSCAPAEINFTLLMACERYIAIRKPFFYARLTRLHAMITISVSMCVSTGFIVWLHFSMWALFLGVGVTFLGAIFVTVSSIFLYRSIKRQCRSIASTIVHQSSELQSNEREVIKRRELKSLKICCIISISFLFTYIPLIMHGVFRINADPTYLDLLPTLVGYSNGIWDVFTFFYVNERSRNILFQCFTRNISPNKIDSHSHVEETDIWSCFAAIINYQRFIYDLLLWFIIYEKTRT